MFLIIMWILFYMQIRPGKNIRVPARWCTDPGKNSLVGIPELPSTIYKQIRALHFDAILRATNHDTFCDGIEYNKFLKQNQQIGWNHHKKSLFHFIDGFTPCRLHACTEWWHVHAAQSTYATLKKSKDHFDIKKKVWI